MKLTVIIPVYCVEATLDRCVESVLRQDVPDMEVIGNTNVYFEADILYSRRFGKTDVDAMLLYNQQAYDDGSIQDYRKQGIAGRLSLTDTTYDHASDYWLQSRAYTHAYAWNKIYRRSLFSHIRFPKGRVFEDVCTLPQLFNPNGITATADGSQLAQLLDAHLSSGMPIDDEYYMYLLNIQIDVWEQTGAPVILERRKVSIRALSGRTKLKAIFNNILAINRLCKISKFIHTFKKPTRW